MGEWKQNMAFENTVSEAKEEGTVNTDQELDQIEVEMGDMTFIHFKPTTAITGTFPENEGNPIIRFWDEQHNNGRKDQGYIGLVFDNPTASVSEEEGTDGTIVLDVADSNEIRVFNTDDKQTELLGDVGVQYGDRMYRGDVIDEIPDERAIVIVSGSASTNVARTFDVNGEPLAGMDETGDKIDGLIELPNGADTDVYSRYAREPELREELYGSEAGVMVVRREEFDPEYAAQVEAGDARPMKYFLVQGDTGEGVERLKPTTGDPVNGSFLEWNWNDTETGAIPDQDLEFVNEYQRSGNSTDSETVRDFIDANRDALTGDTSDEQLVSMIQE